MGLLKGLFKSPFPNLTESKCKYTVEFSIDRQKILIALKCTLSEITKRSDIFNDKITSMYLATLIALGTDVAVHTMPEIFSV